MQDKENYDEHDIRSAISALVSAVEVVKDEWKINPILVERILPLMKDKISEIQIELNNYHNQKK